MNNIKQAEKLIKDCEKKIANWNERSQFKLKGVGNLSRSDMDMIIMYSEQAINNLSTGMSLYHGFMAPRGGVQAVLEAYGLKEEEPSLMWG